MQDVLVELVNRPHTLNATHVTTIPPIDGVSVSKDLVLSVVWWGDLSFHNNAHGKEKWSGERDS